MQKRPGEYSLEFLPEVGRDVQEAYDWYELQSIGLGESLLLSLDVALDVIRRNPLIYNKTYKAIRKANVKRFPFGVFYTLHKEHITVLAIVHLSRHPNTWKKRKRMN